MAAKINTEVPHAKSSFEAGLESYMHEVFHAAKKSARGQPLSEDNVKAKMFDYAIRMLHACGWKPGTVLRAMSMMDSNQDKKTFRIMNDAKRAIRDERRTMFEENTKNEVKHEGAILEGRKVKGDGKEVKTAGSLASIEKQWTVTRALKSKSL